MFRPLAVEDNAAGQLNAGISAGATTIPLKSGEGALFPATKSGSATSGGSGTALNSAGIQALGVAAGDLIENITDGSYAVVRSVSTNAVITSPLFGGSDNTWQNSDEWRIGRFVVTVIQYDTDGVTILKREKVLIDSRATDNLTVATGGRAYDGSPAQSFLADDHVYLLVTSAVVEGILKVLTDIIPEVGRAVKQDFNEAYAVDASGTDDYAITLTPAPVALEDGMVVVFKPATANTGACTLNVNSLGAKAIRKNVSAALVTGDIAASQRVIVIYDAANDWWQMASPAGTAYATQAEVQAGSLVYAADGGANDTYAITLSPAPSAYAAGMHIVFKANTLNTGPATLNVNSLGAISIVKGLSTALETGDIVAGQLVEVIYDGTNFVMVSPPSALVTGGAIVTNHFHKKTFGKTVGNGTTSQNIAHGLTVTPKRIRIKTVRDGGASTGQVDCSEGIFDGTAYAYIAMHGNGATTSAGTTRIIWQDNGNITATAAIDATNITLTWNIAGNTGVEILWEAEV